jgi:YD repeat-containing protein
MRRFLAAASLLLMLGAAPVQAGETAYTYDVLGRVTKVTYPDGGVVEYEYDKAGNRIAVNRTAGTGSGVTVIVVPSGTGFIVIPIES